MTELVLASGSRFRRQLLGHLGIPFTAEEHRVDERSVMRAGLSPEEVTRTLAVKKAESLAPAYPTALILGSDQVVDLDGEVIGKPEDAPAAEAQLRRLRGREHRLITAVALRHPDGHSDLTVDVHRMRLRSLSDEEIRRYVQRDDPLDCAGSYKAEGLGIALFEAIEGTDFTAIVGLPMIAVVTMLRSAGFPIP